MSGLIQILLKPITKISILIKVHIPSKIVCIQLQVQSKVFEKINFLLMLNYKGFILND